MSELRPNRLREALGQFATGVTIVTAAGPDGDPVGVTANSFNSVSLDPPLVLWSLADDALSKAVFLDSEHFCVHVLGVEHLALSERFARRGEGKFDGVNWSPGIMRLPLLDSFVARFQCRTVSRNPVGDHIVFIGKVLQFDCTDERPLVFHGGRYALAERRMMEKRAIRVGERSPGRRESDS